jgi:guanylate kinase
MELTADLQRRLDTLITQRDDYSYSGRELADKSLIAFVAPTAVGKSTLVMECLRICKQRGINADEAGTTTTRERRVGDDPANYVTATEGTTFESIIDSIEKGRLANWSVYGTGDIYGTTPENFPAKYNFMPSMPDSLPMLQRAGFKKVVAIYLVIPVEQWTRQLTERRDDPRFVGRMHEAIASLEYAKDHFDHFIVMENTDGGELLTKRAERIIQHVIDDVPLETDETAIHYINEMLEFAKKGTQ